MNLLTSQKNQLFDIISGEGLNNSSFYFEENRDNLIVFKYKESDFYFSIENAATGYSKLIYIPGSGRVKSINTVVPWENLLVSFKLWVKGILREISIEDKWARLEQEIKAASISFETENDKFSANEFKELKTKMNVLKEQLVHLRLEPTQVETIQNKLDHLTNQAENLSKFDWKSMFVGTIISVIIQLSVSPTNAKALWDLIKQVFSGYFLNL